MTKLNYVSIESTFGNATRLIPKRCFGYRANMLMIPAHLKIDGSIPKPVLARTAGDTLPKVVVKRPKRGFVFPFQRWLREELRQEVESVLFRKDGPLSDFFEHRAVKGVWQDFLHGRTNWSRPWSIYVAEKWTEYHLQADRTN